MAKIYIATDVLGFFAVDEANNIVDKELYERKLDLIASRLIELEKSNYVPELVALIERVKAKGDKIVLEDPELARKLVSVVRGVEIVGESPSPVLVAFRQNFEKYLPSLGLTWEEYRKLLFDVSDLITRLKLRQAVERRDLFIAQAISALDDVDKILNLIASRIREWYGLHFPELEELVRDNREYVSIVYHLGHRSRITEDSLKKAVANIPDDRAKKIVESAKKSIGAEMSEWDLDQLRAYADIFLRLDSYREKLATYIDEAMKEVAPNVRELVGPLLGARLIKLAGGLTRMAFLPASTIQVLGAEKALFRALRTGGKPPKHGVIFQYPEIFRSPRWQRGKIARALAAKLAIAAKADAFTGNFIAPRLKEELMKRIQEIKTLYAKPPPKAPAQPSARAPPPPPPPPRGGERRPPPRRERGRR
ncbi:nop family pre-rRNA processing protein [Pyrobaculum aerophilum]|uniref:Nop family pre-rRNA processing protein n=2 Tax=Pyrobaculum aerophilum TaxID=13773 RepID=Q8ZTI8_PYRAE|nr:MULTISPECIES: nop family pre-rRNA processing protein [Pyrobaculum]AAL64773.1 nop family pre-rRNA processing protein [Pyrobaculum aerophilum str. IM2]MCX8136283.1 C/D box methylation guide ribonucleoprotein complex aNOP56 subunit [Pyrobaculum aerophilum]HII47616.1 C/D box methylation guide ribonucleoprotein complex aNOP56 subunit [Pyrobaculum aerophilum]